MAKLLYQGHASLRICAKAGTVIYVDPFAGSGYEKPADIILVTHEHSDHNQLSLVTKKPDCRIITEKEALRDGAHQRFSEKGVEIRAVEARNKNHDPACCVGYLLTVDGVRLYAAGDTSTTRQMKDLAAEKLDYALLPADGVFNMDISEASVCARLIGARRTIPIHLKPGALFDPDRAKLFNAPGALILEPGREIEL